MSETLFASLGLKREHNGSQCWEDQGVGQVQAHRNLQVSPSPPLLPTSMFVAYSQLAIDGHHHHLDFTVDIDLQEKL